MLKRGSSSTIQGKIHVKSFFFFAKNIAIFALFFRNADWCGRK